MISSGRDDAFVRIPAGFFNQYFCRNLNLNAGLTASAPSFRPSPPVWEKVDENERSVAVPATAMSRLQSALANPTTAWFVTLQRPRTGALRRLVAVCYH